MILNKYEPFSSIGDDYADSNPIFAYYFYRFYFGAAQNLLRSANAEMRPEIEAKIKCVNDKMGEMNMRCSLQMDQSQNMNDMLQYTELMFAQN
jgi:hypothetical protein